MAVAVAVAVVHAGRVLVGMQVPDDEMDEFVRILSQASSQPPTHSPLTQPQPEN